MTPEEIDKLTIAEVRAIAERAHVALKQLRDVQSLLGGAAASQSATASQSPSAAAPPSMPPDMRAQREMLLARNREALPADIRAAEGM